MPLTSAVWDNFKLRQGTNEPGSFRIGDGGGAAVLTGTIDTANLDTILQEGVESATANNTTGQIARTLPVAHPRWPWLFLKNVDNAVGVSFTEKQDADPEGTLEAPALPFWADYQKYIIQATFEPRPYILLQDQSMTKFDLSYYLENDNGAVAPTVKSCWKEWWRYVEWIRQPAAEYLTADIGINTWSTPGGDGAAAGPLDKTSAGTGQIRVLQPAATWKINWYKVPYNYVLSDNSYFDKYLGHINQFAWGGFAVGAGLLQAVTVLRVYPSPFPEFNAYAGHDVVAQDKLCDLEFMILEVRRTPSIVVSPTNRSHIAAGHNCILYAKNGLYYYLENFKVGGVAGTGKPIYPSAPFELLFQNPDGP